MHIDDYTWPDKCPACNGTIDTHLTSFTCGDEYAFYCLSCDWSDDVFFWADELESR